MTESRRGQDESNAALSASGEKGAAAPLLRISDRYHVSREIGHGGMATVYLARDLRYDRDVAVKVLSPDFAAGMASERFLLEIAVVAKLTHPHIVPLLDSGETDGRLWFVMPMIEGASLRARLDRERQLPVADAVRIAREVASALAYAHEHGVVHRDIKPENVLISGASVAVSDFGLAKVVAAAGGESLTRTGVSVGTTLYMSPEQCTGSDVVDTRTDIYSLGCMLFEMLVGEPPYIGKTAQSILAKHITDPVPRARRLRDTIPPALDDVIAQAMAKIPADRWRDAASFAEALARSVDSGGYSSVSIAAPPAETLPAARPVPRRRIVQGVAAAALLALGAFATVRVLTGNGGGGGASRSIAVLPFTNLSSDADDEYFTDGITDELIGMLSEVDGLRVAARTSSNAFKGRDIDLSEVGSKLRVDAVLTGSVRKHANEVRVLAELVNVADGQPLWSQTFARTVSGVFALQEELARAIVAAMQLNVGDDQRLARRTTADVEAYQLYLKGRYAWNQRTPASLRQASEWFRQAVARDSSFARAWAGIADVHLVQALNFFEPPGPNYAAGKSAALRALALDSTIAEAYASLGTVHFLFDRDWAAADAAYQRSLALDPEYSAGRYFYALFLSGRRRFNEAIAEADRAMAIDPLAPPIAQATGIVYVQSGRYSEAVAPLRAAIALQPQYYFPHSWLAIALAMTGARSEAIAEANRAKALAPGYTLVQAIAGFVYALAGDRQGALAAIAELERAGRTQTIPLHYIGRIYDALGDAPRAFDFIRRAAAVHEGQLSQLMTEPRMRSLENNPAFAEFLKQLRLP
ncbi:MAG TPA: protein kinase [Gemmatimonadaceae bacterium]